MNGWPVWLASVSWSPGGRKRSTEDWDSLTMRTARGHLTKALSGVGDPSRWRLFRMNVTLCMHRAISREEYEALPESFRTCVPRHLAGGPVEVLGESEPGSPSTRPCENVRRAVVDLLRPDLWIPQDCGSCAPCRARSEIEAQVSATPDDK